MLSCACDFDVAEFNLYYCRLFVVVVYVDGGLGGVRGGGGVRGRRCGGGGGFGLLR
jgi:hypothetical protein